MIPVSLSPKFLPFDGNSFYGRLTEEVFLFSEKFFRDGLNEWDRTPFCPGLANRNWCATERALKVHAVLEQLKGSNKRYGLT